MKALSHPDAEPLMCDSWGQASDAEGIRHTAHTFGCFQGLRQFWSLVQCQAENPCLVQ